MVSARVKTPVATSLPEKIVAIPASQQAKVVVTVTAEIVTVEIVTVEIVTVEIVTVAATIALNLLIAAN
jgi:hypothetical protein